MEARDAKTIIEAVAYVESVRTGRPQLYDFLYEITGPAGTSIRGLLVDCQGSVLTIAELNDEGARNRKIEWDAIEHIGITTN